MNKRKRIFVSLLQSQQPCEIKHFNFINLFEAYENIFPDHIYDRSIKIYI